MIIAKIIFETGKMRHRFVKILPSVDPIFAETKAPIYSKLVGIVASDTKQTHTADKKSFAQ